MSVSLRYSSLIAWFVLLICAVGLYFFVKKRHRADAHIEAEFTYVYPSLSGRLQLLSIDRGAWVDPKEVLFSVKQNNKSVFKKEYAQKSAQVFDVYFKAGDWVTPSKPVLSLLSPEDVKLVFVYPEHLLDRIRLNQKIKVKGGACKPWCFAVIKKVEGGLFPRKVQRDYDHVSMRRIEAYFQAKDARKLHPGEHVEVVI